MKDTYILHDDDVMLIENSFLIVHIFNWSFLGAATGSPLYCFHLPITLYGFMLRKDIYIYIYISIYIIRVDTQLL